VIALATAAQSGSAGPKSKEPPETPDLTASVVIAAAGAPFDAGSHPRKAKKGIAGTIYTSVLPSGPGTKNSITIGRCQFCKDGVGGRWREIVGRGSRRKRTYLA